jgi:putative endonuclease
MTACFPREDEQFRVIPCDPWASLGCGSAALGSPGEIVRPFSSGPFSRASGFRFRISFPGGRCSAMSSVSEIWQRARTALGLGHAEPPHLRAGRWGEERAAAFLRRQGLRIVGRRVRVGRRGELDVLAIDGETLVFVEVKTRADESFGRAAAAVDRKKRRHLGLAAVRYLQRLKEKPNHFRFDIVEVVGVEGGPEPEITHIENAFSLDRRIRLPW